MININSSKIIQLVDNFCDDESLKAEFGLFTKAERKEFSDDVQIAINHWLSENMTRLLSCYVDEVNGRIL